MTALADSEYNAFELRQAGFASVSACALLFDVDHLLAAATAPVRNEVFTVLFVGRLARSKGQLELVEAYARFREIYAGKSRLVLVGRNNEDAYATELFARVRALQLHAGPVQITGLVDDDALRRWYAAADLYVSLSQHEGFGVPLIEAMAHDLPVLALSSGAVAHTLGEASPLLEDTLPGRVAARMAELATDPASRAAIAARQRRSLDRFRVERQVPTLRAALERAGARQILSETTVRAITTSMQVTIAGHVNGSYSLAEVNRSLALALDAARPGTVRMRPVEGELTTELSGIPPGQRDAVSPFMTRSPPLTGPHVVISQHYPVWAPLERGDLTLAFFFWEESLVPAATVGVLNASFDGVLAPTQVVAKALIDSGVEIPVRVLGHAPALERFRALRDDRSGTGSGGRFTFLHVSSAFPRKGVDVLLAAYAAAFRASDDVTLVIKSFPNPHNSVAEQIARLQAADPEAPEIELIDRDVTEAELLDLYRRADVMVLPTRGEGFNLPAAEALASGLKLIVTGHGGHMDFVADAPDGAVRLLDYTMAPADGHLSTPFSLWAAPDPADLAAALCEAVKEPGGAVPELPDLSAPLAARLGGIVAELLDGSPPEPRMAFVTTWDVPCGIAGYSRHLIGALPQVPTVFADRRTAPRGGDGENPAVVPAWTIGEGDDLPGLGAAIVRENPAVVVFQHQPGLLSWRDLARLIDLSALHGRVLCVALHNTQHLLEVEPDDRALALAALARVSRVIVHTVRDVNRLAGLGLRNTVTMIPQGVPDIGDEAGAGLRTIDAGRAPVIGCYGFFLPGKGIGQLIAALPAVQRRFPGATLRLVNAVYPNAESADELERCRHLVERLELTKTVEFATEYLEEHRSTALLAECDLIVLPYQRSSEASSAALRSAMAANVPIAVTALPLFDEAETAVHRLSATDPADLAAGISALLADDDGRRRLVDDAERWRRQRAWSGVAQRWDGLLRGLAASKVVMGRELGPHPVR